MTDLPSRRPQNRLITRGMGTSRGLPGRTSMVVAGFGGLLSEIARRIIKIGQSGTKRALKELEDVIVWAKLIRVNDERPEQQIEGFTKIRIDLVRTVAARAITGISSKVRKSWEDIKVTVKRIKY